MERIGRAFNHMSSRFVGGALNDRDELVSLLCTPAVGSSLGGVRANRCTNTPPSQLYSPAPANLYDNQHRQQARGSTGSRSGSQSQGYAIGHQTAWPDQYHKQSQAYNAEGMTAGQFQNVHRPEAYTAGLQSAVPLQYNDYARSHASGSRTVGRYRNQQQRREYSPYQHAGTTRHEPAGRRWFHDAPAQESGYQASSSNTAWQW